MGVYSLSIMIRSLASFRLYALSFLTFPLVTSGGDATTPNLAESVEKALPAVQNYAAEAMERIGVPGLAVVVVYQDEVVLLETMGTRKAGEDWPITGDTVFQFASLSKPMTSSVVAAAVDRNLLAFGDRVTHYGVPLRLSEEWTTRHVTVADLLSHRSGLPDHAGDYLEDLGFPVEVILDRVGQLEPGYPFRDGYAYTNFGFTAGGLAAAGAAEMSFADMAEAYMFKPLGMENTSFRFSDYRDAKDRAYGHYRGKDDSWKPLFVRDADQQAPAGGLSASLKDYSRWMRMQLGKGEFEGETIVSPEVLVETWRPHSQTGYNPDSYQAGYYALGWNVGSDPDLGLKLSHSGAFNLGTRTAVYLFPESDLGIAVATHAGSNGVPEAIALAFEDFVTRGEVRRDWIQFADQYFLKMESEFTEYEIDPAKRPENPGPPAADSAYTGTYRNEYFGPLEVTAKEGALSMSLGPEPKVFPLRHWDADTFLFQPTGENAAGPGAVLFDRDDKAVAESVTIPYFDGDGMGTFERVE